MASFQHPQDPPFTPLDITPLQGHSKSTNNNLAPTSLDSLENIIEKYVRPQTLLSSGIMDTSLWSDSTRVWVPKAALPNQPNIDAPFILAKILLPEKQTNEVNIEVTDTKERVTVQKNLLLPINPPRYDKHEDMTGMSELNPATVLYNLSRRYSNSLIHTWSGLYLVIINPYRQLPIYAPSIIDWYSKKGGGKNSENRRVAPHIFSVAESAYRLLLSTRRSQSILITGESGAGKTENTKRAIQYLATIAHTSVPNLDTQILATNPILESFGNAQTIRNNNSSRFGKYIKIDVDVSDGSIVSARMDKYLLEKSRVTKHSKGERSFHIFYQLLADASDELLNGLYLNSRNPDDYTYLKNFRDSTDNIDDVTSWNELQTAMKNVGIDEAEQVEYWRVLAAILLLGNLKYTHNSKNPDDEQAEIENEHILEPICSLLGVNQESFKQGMLHPIMRAGRDIVSQSRDIAQVQQSTEALSRTLYERLFGRLVDRLNVTIAGNIPFSSSSSAKKKSTSLSIGVLDIAGFEIFESRNSLEQLLVNHTNERLQQLFNHHAFVEEQALYTAESIPWQHVDYGLDRQPTIDLLERRAAPAGILASLDEDAVMPKSTDQTFTSKVTFNWKPFTDVFTPHRFDSDQHFTIHHYAGLVEYTTQGWLDRNRDPLNDTLARILVKSSLPHVSELFSDYTHDDNHRHVNGMLGTSFRTLAQRHREGLTLLMQQLSTTQPHFVRCIVPNKTKSPGILDQHLLLHQLQCNGVLEGIRICRSGYPGKLAYSDFCRLYEVLVDDGQILHAQRPSSSSTPLPGTIAEDRARARNLLDALELVENTHYALGRTRLFFRAGQLGALDDARDNRLSTILKSIQSACRTALAHKVALAHERQLTAIKLLQHNIRVLLSLQNDSYYRVFSEIRPFLTATRHETRIRQLENDLESLSLERDRSATLLRSDLVNERNKIDRLIADKANLEKELFVLTVRINELKEERDATLLQMNQAQQKNLEVNEKLLDSDKRIKNLLEESSFLRDQISNLEELKQSSMSEITRLHKKLERGTIEREEALNEVKKVLTKVDELRTINGELEREKLHQKTLVNEFREKASTLQEQLDQTKQSNEQVLSQLNFSHENAIKTLRVQLSAEQVSLKEEFESQRRRLQRELQAASFELEQEHKQSVSLRELLSKQQQHVLDEGDAEELRTLKREVVRLEQKSKDLSRFISEASEREEVLHDQLATSNEQTRQLRIKVADVEDSFALSERQKQTLNTRIDTLSEQLSELQSVKQVCDVEYRKQESRIRLLESRVSTLEDEKAEIEDQLRFLEHASKLTEAELLDERRRVDTLKAEKVELEAQLKDLQCRLLENNNQNEDDDDANGTTFLVNSPATQACLRDIRGRLQAASQERSSLLSDIRRLERSLHDLECTLADHESTSASLSESLQKSESRIRRLSTRIDELELQLLESERHRRRLERELLDEKEQKQRLFLLVPSSLSSSSKRHPFQSSPNNTNNLHINTTFTANLNENGLEKSPSKQFLVENNQ